MKVIGLAVGMTVAVGGRNWQSISPKHGFEPPEMDINEWRFEVNPLFTDSPTMAPTTDIPSMQPSDPPTNKPTAFPTSNPTDAPTTSPTAMPTSSDPYPNNPVPLNPPRWYFNYDASPNSRYGPGYVGVIRDQGSNEFRVGIKNNQWGLVGSPPSNYWEEFTDNGYGPWRGSLGNRNPTRNMCNRVGRQSPIDVRSTGARCDEFHEVRSLPGDMRVRGDRVFKMIEPNKLRLIYQRRPCGDLRNVACQEPDPPHADFPNRWAGFADVTHIDFKVPAEHKINGVAYDAEMQIFHIHPLRQRTPTQTVLIRALPNGFNAYLQRALDSFRAVYDENKAKCANRRRNLSNEISEIYERLGTGVVGNASDYSTRDVDGERKLQGVWDPHHPDLLPTIHFYRYDGSLTEPPCGEFVSWFVADKPMIISYDQLEEMKLMLFTNVDGNCEPTSVHYNHSVARPIQELGDRPVWQCKPSDFGPDP